MNNPKYGDSNYHSQDELLPTVKFFAPLQSEEAPQGRNQEELQAQRCAV
jgi:hypothetical protein|tara:strand:- start:495 stop:641 length:147 start_codon:yes stop_codon:yes gene_type:complete